MEVSNSSRQQHAENLAASIMGVQVRMTTVAVTEFGPALNHGFREL